MRRIEGQRNVHIASRRFHVRRKALVILDVAGALEFIEVVFAFKLFKKFLRRLAIAKGKAQPLIMEREIPLECLIKSSNRSTWSNFRDSGLRSLLSRRKSHAEK